MSGTATDPEHRTGHSPGNGPEVLVVGAGPVGLMAASELLRRGVRVRLIDKEAELARETRAMAVHPRTLELLAQMGVADELVDRSVRVRAVNGYRGDDRLFRLDASDVKDIPYPYMAFTPQYETESVLLRLFEQLGGTVERAELRNLRQDAGEVVAEVTSPDGAIEEIHTRWLVAADGSHSRARHALGVSFTGERLEESFLLGDVDIAWSRPLDEVHLWLHTDGAFRVMPLPGDKRVRVMASVDNLPSDGETRSSADVLQRLLAERTGDTTARLSNPVWLADFTVSLRVVDRYRVGRVFLAGDSAHVNSFFGGRGMNTGLMDAFNLAWKLALVIREKAGASLLDTYEEERLPVAKGVIRDTGRLTKANLITNPVLGFARDELTRALNLRPVQERVIENATLLTMNYRESSLSQTEGSGRPLAGPKAGDRAPDGALVQSDTRTATTVFEQFRGTHFTLFLFQGADEADRSSGHLTRTADAAKELLADEAQVHIVVRDAIPAGLASYDDSLLLDPDGKVHDSYGAGNGGGLYLIRPDGHIALRARTSAEALSEYLENTLRWGRSDAGTSDQDDALAPHPRS